MIQPYTSCPLCGFAGHVVEVGVFSCMGHPLWHAALPSKMRWVRCESCGHVYTESYWTHRGFGELFRRAMTYQVEGGGRDEWRRAIAPIVERVIEIRGSDKGYWVDIGSGNGSLVMTAAEFGFEAVGVDVRHECVRALQRMGYSAVESSFEGFRTDPVDVLSMMDVLEHMPFPNDAMRKAADIVRKDGVLAISSPNMECSSWKALDAERKLPYWSEIEHHHNFSRASMYGLLEKFGFKPVWYGVSKRYVAGMEIIAVRQ